MLEEISHDPRWRAIGEDPTPDIHLFLAGSQQRLPPFTVYENREAFPRESSRFTGPKHFPSEVAF